MDVDFDKKILEKAAKAHPEFLGDVGKQEEAIREELGFEDAPVPFDEPKMKEALKHPAVKQVRVFKMQAAVQEKRKATAKKKRKDTKKARKKGRK